LPILLPGGEGGRRPDEGKSRKQSPLTLALSLMERGLFKYRDSEKTININCKEVIT